MVQQNQGHLLGPCARIVAAGLYNVNVIPVVKYHVPLALYVLLYVAIRFVGIAIWTLSSDKRPTLAVMTNRNVLVTSVVFLSISFLYVSAGVYLPLGLAVVIMSSSPVVTLVVNSCLNQRMPRPILLLICLICLVGAIIAYEPWSGESKSSAWLGYVIVIADCFFEGIMPLLNSRLRQMGLQWDDQIKVISPAMLFFAMPLFCCGAMLTVGFQDTWQFSRTIESYKSHALLIVFCALGLALAGMLYTVAYSIYPDITVPAVASFSELAFAILVQVIILHEPASTNEIIGAALVSIGLMGLGLAEAVSRISPLSAEGGQEEVVEGHCNDETLPLLFSSQYSFRRLGTNEDDVNK
uniref:EamA domain-containing protein n=1 Tax=Aureoumbra lagunensis TaxID=44058 RepID=A0A7S3JYX1_9STRA